MSTLDKVYGNDMQTKCAWCLNKLATQEYVGLMAGMEYVLYQVCDVCYNDAPNKAEPDQCPCDNCLAVENTALDEIEPTINDIKRMIEESEQADEATN